MHILWYAGRFLFHCVIIAYLVVGGMVSASLRNIICAYILVGGTVYASLRKKCISCGRWDGLCVIA